MEAVAKEKATLRASNMVLLGAASPYIGLEPEQICGGIEAVFAPKGEKMVETNIAAFHAGRQTALEQQ
jgi:indolepyruvate ferredoxin oxidoreductase beta subunit